MSVPNDADAAPAKPRVRAERKEITRRKLLDAAQRLFTEKGFFETRASDIAQAAGVAHGTTFAHFGSKAGLLLQLLIGFTERRSELLVRLTREAREAGATREEEFWTALNTIWRSDLENLGLIRAYASYSWLWAYDLESAHMELRATNRRHLSEILERAGMDLPPGSPDIDARVALFYADYREVLRVYKPEREDALWAHIQATARFLFPFPETATA